MKTICSLLVLISLLFASAGYAQDAGVPAAKPASKNMMKFVFLLGRANHFRVLVKQRRCDLVNEQLFASANQRFEIARSQLATKYGEKFFPPDNSAGGPISDRECDPPTLASFDMKVREIEQLLVQQTEL